MSGARWAALLAMGCAAVGCASEPPPRPQPPRGTPVLSITDEAAPVEAPTAAAAPAPIDHVAAAATPLGVDPTSAIWSPGKKAFVLVVPPRATLTVFTAHGDRLARFDPVIPGAVADLQFLGEDRLIYRVPANASERGKHKGGKSKTGASGARATAGTPSGTVTPVTVYAIQPLAAGSTPITCKGRRFVFSPQHDHVAFVAGEPGHEFVAVDGVRVFPRSGLGGIQGPPAWSRDGVSLALMQTAPKRRLVVLVEVDNPTGDSTWALPPEAADPALQVFWAGAGNVVVGPSLTKPVFAASFQREPNPVAAPRPNTAIPR